MATLFTKIIQGEIPCHKIAEDENFFAFLDIRPVNPGHTLVVPKKELDYIFDHEDNLLAGILPFAKKIAVAIKKVVPCKRIGIMVAGLEVPHTHVHLVPINAVSELNFSRAEETDPEELAELAKEISTVFANA